LCIVASGLYGTTTISYVILNILLGAFALIMN
jgi:hypothetical protein